MNDGDRTVPRRITGVPVRELRVRVLHGPDAGLEATSSDEPITVGTAEHNTLVLGDRHVSRFHLELDRRGDRITVSDLGSTNGSYVGALLFEGSTVAVPGGTVVRVGETELAVSDGNVKMEDAPRLSSFGPAESVSPGMQRVMERAERLARTDVPILWLGESGTGKELFARAVHEHGPAPDAPFVIVDCGAVSDNLFQSTLFGHEKGAFTGAERTHVGALERAQTGTLFFDEIGELSETQQATLLGVLERRRFQRVGGSKELSLGARIMAATNRDLRAEVNRGGFRLDLYYRLAVTTLKLPPLRERAQDIGALVRRFVIEAGYDQEPEDLLGADTLKGLYAHSWPGNVRELRNTVNATLALGEPPELYAAPTTDAGDGPDAAGASGAPGDVIARALALDYREAKAAVTHEFEARYLKHLLERAGGNVRQAARLARMNRAYLIELLDRHGLR